MAEHTQAAEELSPIKRALLGVQKLQAKVEQLESRRREPVAVVGMGLRLPRGVRSPEALWQMLTEGLDGISEVPPERWGREFYSADPKAPGATVSHRGGFVDGIDGFDAAFFGIPPRDADHMDPQHRLLLEVSWEAFEDAGLPLAQLAGSRTGVYAGMMTNDYVRLLWRDARRADAYATTGFSFTFGPNRLSYLFDLRGPSMAIDTACSSSLVALHLACQSLRDGETDVALAGGVNALLLPEASISFSKMGMLSPDGRCKTFDASANGYVRGEGCAMFVLKRLSDALAAGDSIWALVRGTAVNQDGRSNGFTAPSAAAHEAAMRDALEAAGLDPSRVTYVEAHGTGTSLGDPIEVEALRRVYGAPPADGAGPPCVLGSIKTQIGHLEAAAGAAGLAKVALAMRHRTLPANLHFGSLNPLIDLSGTRLQVATEARAWEADERHAALSSYGAGGTNGHAVLSEPPPAPELPPEPSGESRVLLVSARGPEALRANATAWARWLLERPAGGVRDVCFTAAVRRTHHDHRLAVVGRDRRELAAQLEAWAAGEARPGVAAGRAGERAPRVAFVFSGHGSEWRGMGRELLAREPAFRESLERCDAALRPHVGWSLVALLSADDSDRQIDEKGAIQPVTFGLQVALAALWASWGVRPDAVVGHSLGEVAAAHVAGALTLEQAACLIAHRARLVQRARGRGGVAVLGLNAEQTARELEPFANRLWVSAYNAPNSTAVAGDVEALEQLAARAAERGVLCRRVRMDFAAHSPHVEPLRAELERELAGLSPARASVPIYSSVTGQASDGADLGPAYWGANLREPVRFADAVGRLAADGFDTFVEVSPHPVLLQAVDGTLQAAGARALLLPTLRRNEPERDVALGSVAALHTAGVAVEWAAFFPEGGRVEQLPPYAWQHARHWVDGGAAATSAPARRGEHPLLGERVSSSLHPGTHLWEGELSLPAQPWLAEHRVRGSAVLPAAAYVDLALAVARQLWPEAPHALEGLELFEALIVPEKGAVRVQLGLVERPEGGATMRLASQSAEARGALWNHHASATLRPAPVLQVRAPLGGAEARGGRELDAGWHYGAARARGLDYGPAFQGVTRVRRVEGEALAAIVLPAEVAAEAAAYVYHPALLDACLQVLLAALPGTERLGSAADTWLPVRLGRVEPGEAPPRGELTAWARVVRSEGDAHEGEVWLANADGQTVVAMREVGLRRVRQDVRTLLAVWRHEVRWKKAAAPAAGHARRAGTWLVLGDRGDAWKTQRDELMAAGGRVVVALPGDDYQQVEPHAYRVRPERPEDFARLLAEAGVPDRGVVHLGALTASDADAAAFARAFDEGPVAAMHLVQALAKAGATNARLWLVTRATQAPAGGDAISAAGALLWGLGRTLAHEHPELNPSLVDLGHDGTEGLRALAREVLAGDAETQVALRGSERYVARLERGRSTDATAPPRFAADATYLVTGGLGGLGLAVAGWLIESGARHLVLVGRSAPAAEATARLRAFEQAGARVEFARADVADAAHVRRVLEGIDPSRPLRGIFHAAGVLEDGIVLQQSRERWQRVWAPKALGAWNLHRLSHSAPLDHFVLFSSATALLGNAGQSSYAAANALLDALARQRRAEGLPALSVQWGAWSEVGMAAT
nr:type I polyketide synthase [Polyangiaceae bacterium]